VNKRRMIISVMCGVLLIVGGLQARVYVGDTIVKYHGACGKLSGFPGVLQTVGVLQHEACATVAPHNACASPGATCGGSGPHLKTCQNTAAGCVCQ